MAESEGAAVGCAHIVVVNDDSVDARDLSAHARYVSDLTELVGQFVDEFDVFYSPADAIPTIVRWTVGAAREAGVTVDAFIRSSGADLQACAVEVGHLVLLELAEERPGTDPWGHELVVDVPMPAVGMMVHALSLCGNLALGNDAAAWAHQALALTGRVSALAAEQFLRGEQRPGSMLVRVRGGELPMQGPILKFPQPALSVVARFLDGVAARVERGVWSLGPLSREDREDLALNLRHESTMLRDLTARFGSRVGPVNGS